LLHIASLCDLQQSRCLLSHNRFSVRRVALLHFALDDERRVESASRIASKQGRIALKKKLQLILQDAADFHYFLLDPS
jgi:hypothetical protein